MLVKIPTGTRGASPLNVWWPSPPPSLRLREGTPVSPRGKADSEHCQVEGRSAIGVKGVDLGAVREQQLSALTPVGLRGSERTVV